MGAYLKGGLFEGQGVENIFLVVGHLPVEAFLLVSYLFDATHSNGAFLMDMQIFVN